MGIAQDLFDAIESHAAATGWFDSVNTAEPKAAPGNGLTCAIWIQSIRPIQASGLNSTSARVEFSVRIYTNMLAEPDSGTDPNLTAATLALMEDYTGDFGLSVIAATPTVRSLDLLGAHGPGLEAEGGYLNIGGGLYRVLTITVPVIINDLWTQTQ